MNITYVSNGQSKTLAMSLQGSGLQSYAQMTTVTRGNNCTITGGNTVTMSDHECVVISDKSHTTGKYYVEFSVQGYLWCGTGPFFSAGAVNNGWYVRDANWNNVAPSAGAQWVSAYHLQASSYSSCSGDSSWRGAGNTSNWGPSGVTATNLIIGMKLDFDNGKAYVSVNGGAYQGGNVSLGPSAIAKHITVSGNGKHSGSAGQQSTSKPTVITVNTGPNFQYAIPSGYTAW